MKITDLVINLNSLFLNCQHALGMSDISDIRLQMSDKWDIPILNVLFFGHSASLCPIFKQWIILFFKIHLFDVNFYGTEFAKHSYMNLNHYPTIVIPTILAEELAKYADRYMEKKQIEFETTKPERIKVNKKIISTKYANRMGFQPIDGQTEKIKKILNEIIITEFKKQKIRHMDLSGMTGINRPKITQILNRDLRKVTLDFLIRVASALEIAVNINVKATN